MLEHPSRMLGRVSNSLHRHESSHHNVAKISGLVALILVAVGVAMMMPGIRRYIRMTMM
jgi:hypothetical protein